MILADRLKRWIKPRFAILYPLGIYLAVFTHPSDRSILFGVGFIIPGILMRIWANGYAIKMGKLTTSGPYQFVRNPLYLGTALIVIGFIIMLKIFLLGAAFVLAMGLVYSRTIKREEQMLTVKFGEDYRDYRQRVPAVIPTFVPYRKGEKWSFSWQRLWESREHKILLWIPFIIIAFHLKEEFFVEREKMDTRILVFVVVAIVLGLLDLLSEIIRSLEHREEGGHT